MPRFFFDLREDGNFVTDDEGQECADLDAAERVACETAAEVGRDTFAETPERKVIIEVSNDRRQRVLVATASLQVERLDPGP